MTAALLIIFFVCFAFWVCDPGLVGNLFIWLIALIIGALGAYWLGVGGFIAFMGLAGAGAFIISSQRWRRIKEAERNHYARLRREGKNWMHY